MSNLNPKKTFAAVGNAEDVSEIITNISPDETPLFSMFGTAEVTATKHEWLEDSLRAPGSNAHLEGATRTTNDASVRERLYNYTQIMKEGYNVSGTQEAVNKYGVASEIGHQMEKAAREIALDAEYAIINNASRVLGTSAVASQFGGIPAFITTNVTDAGGADLTERQLNDSIQEAWSTGGKPDVIVVNAAQKRKISSFTGGAVSNIERKDKMIVNTVDVYVSEFGTLRVMLNRWVANDDVLILEMDKWKKGFLRPFRDRMLPETEDATARDIIGEMTIEARAEEANALINNLSV